MWIAEDFKHVNKHILRILLIIIFTVAAILALLLVAAWFLMAVSISINPLNTHEIFPLFIASCLTMHILMGQLPRLFVGTRPY